MAGLGCLFPGSGPTHKRQRRVERPDGLLLEGDDEATTRAKVHETVVQYVPDETERQWIEPALLALLGFQSGIASQELFAAWRTFFERLTLTSPVVMVFEDFHYADPGLVDCAHALVANVEPLDQRLVPFVDARE